MDNKSVKKPKRLIINCCGHNMKVMWGNYQQELTLRSRMCLKCHKRVYTVQYPNANEKIIDEDIIKKWQQLIKKEV